MADTKFSLKLLIDKNANKILFAEAGKEFVDFLFNLLSLPVGTVIGLITNATMVGCIGNLYESLENMNEAYMQPNQNKDLILKPSIRSQATNVSLLLSHSSLHPMERKFYRCRNRCSRVTDRPNIICNSCGNSMSQEVEFINTNNSSAANSTREEGYVKGLVTYMVTDDLSVSPMSMISGVALLNKFNVMNFGALEEKVVEFGINEGLELLKVSLQSKAVLTTVFLESKGAKVDAASN